MCIRDSVWTYKHLQMYSFSWKEQKVLPVFIFIFIFVKKLIMKILVNHNSAIPLYLQIEEQLRTIIKGEEYKQGKMLPNEIDLSRQLGISCLLYTSCSSFFEFTPFYIVITKALVIESYRLNVTIVFGYIFCFYDKFFSRVIGVV